MDCKNFEIWQCASGGMEVKYFYHTQNPVDSAEITGKAIPIIMEALEAFKTNRREELLENRFYKETIIPETSFRYMGIIGDGFKANTRFFHYTYAEADNSSIQDMQKAAMESVGKELVPCASCLSDLSVIQKYGSPNAFGFGIGRDFSEYGGAHQPDEFITCDSLVEYAKIMATYVLKTMF